MTMPASRLLLLATVLASSPAAAVILPGPPPCPTIFAPPPCLIKDTPKHLELVKKVKTEAEKVKQITAQVQRYRRAHDVIGQKLTNAIGNVKNAPPLLLSDTVRPVTEFEKQISAQAGRLPRAVELAASQLTTIPGSRPTAKEQVARTTAATAYATAIRSHAAHGAQAVASMKNLSQAGASATSLREDIAVNSRVRLELLRQRVVGESLLSTYVQMRSASIARDQRPVPALQQWTVTQPVATKRIGNETKAWVDAFNLSRLAGAAERIAASAKLVRSLRDVQRDLAVVGQMSRAADRARDDARQKLQKALNDLPRSKLQNAALGQRLTAALNNLPQQYQTAIASGRADLNQLGEMRGITGRDRADGADPRDVIGTWADPMKNGDTRAITQKVLTTSGFGSLNSAYQNKVADLAIAYQDAKLFADYASNAAADAQSAYAQIDRAIAATEAARGVDLDGPAWKQAVGRLDTAAQPIERSLAGMSGSAAYAIGADVKADISRINRAASQP